MFKSDSESKRQSILYEKKQKTGRLLKFFDHATSTSPKFSTRHVGVADWPRHLITAKYPLSNELTSSALIKTM